ncbi:type I secretion system permease/ATPase [Chelativorans multitrophicus]|uniref:type I secretion system permease/ATPase n=1 Tax=Chelativorans multitrophicus TaxID=449973 RepID=UPI001408F0FF|nr:type I secretion system permease/ATPase [Chelativorans multitrophicus]
MTAMKVGNQDQTALEKAVRGAKPAFGYAIFLGLFINILALVAPLYMMQVYDRVIMSRNMTTLLMLTLIAGALLISYALLEAARSRTLVRAGILFDRQSSDQVFDSVQRSNIVNVGDGSSQGLRDLDRVREYLTGNGLIAICDAPWAPIFILSCFMLHPWYGFVATAGAIVLFFLGLLNNRLTRTHLEAGSRAAIGANHYATTTLRNAEATRAMGMMGALRERWQRQHEDVLGWQALASERSGAVMAVSKFIRMGLQIAILGVGAYLVVTQNISAGSMIAASIMMGRALAPVEQAVGNWRGLVAARESYRRLNELLKAVPPERARMSMPTPTGELSVEQVIAAPPGAQKPVLKGITFAVRPGEVLGVLGASGAGKSTLARLLVGVWPYVQGAIRLDGTELPHWNSEELGHHIGYLPQDVELFGGTIADNISRFDSKMDPDKVIAAAEMAGVHDLIQKLPQGYNTEIGTGGQALSGGQRQRIGLARAVYGSPPLVVLDEPNSNLDLAGETALLEAIRRLRDSGKTVVLITHKANVIGAVDKLLVLNDGVAQMFGPRDEVMARLSSPRVVPLQPNAQFAEKA